MVANIIAKLASLVVGKGLGKFVGGLKYIGIGTFMLVTYFDAREKGIPFAKYFAQRVLASDLSLQFNTQAYIIDNSFLNLLAVLTALFAVVFVIRILMRIVKVVFLNDSETGRAFVLALFMFAGIEMLYVGIIEHELFIPLSGLWFFIIALFNGNLPAPNWGGKTPAENIMEALGNETSPILENSTIEPELNISTPELNIDLEETLNTSKAVEAGKSWVQRWLDKIPTWSINLERS